MCSDLSRAAADISRRLSLLELKYSSEALAGLHTLDRLVPETAAFAIKALGSRTVAALWLANRAGQLCGERPWNYIARCDVADVRHVLNAIGAALHRKELKESIVFATGIDYREERRSQQSPQIQTKL